MHITWEFTALFCSNTSHRLYVDYRALNSVTIKDRYTLPLVNETLDRIRGVRYFTTLDLKDAYYRIRIRTGDK